MENNRKRQVVEIRAEDIQNLHEITKISNMIAAIQQKIDDVVIVTLNNHTNVLFGPDMRGGLVNDFEHCHSKVENMIKEIEYNAQKIHEHKKNHWKTTTLIVGVITAIINSIITLFTKFFIAHPI